MARNRTLQELLFDLRAELGMATDSTVGQSENPALKVLLRRTREILYDDYDWPHLTGQWFDTTLSAGQRYYTFPSGLNYERAVEAWTQWGNEWLKLEAGFGPDTYNERDSGADERNDPPQRWRVYSGTQFEVWPLPATSGNTVRFIGTTALGAFEADSDTCELDGTMVVLFAAAERLAGKDKGEAMAAAAARRLAQVKARSNKTEPSFRMIGRAPSNRAPERVVRVAS
jgi:hypothetical protein